MPKDILSDTAVTYTYVVLTTLSFSLPYRSALAPPALVETHTRAISGEPLHDSPQRTSARSVVAAPELPGVMRCLHLGSNRLHLARGVRARKGCLSPVVRVARVAALHRSSVGGDDHVV